MVDSISSRNATGLITALMNGVAAKQNLQVGLVKKAQDVEKMQGERGCFKINRGRRECCRCR
jgi:hypothetical protein